MKSPEELETPLPQLLTENFNQQEIDAIGRKMDLIILHSLSFSFNKVWKLKALISQDWNFFEEHLEKELDELNIGILHYIILNGNAAFLQRALEKIGRERFDNLCIIKPAMEPAIIATHSLSVEMLEWLYQYEPTLFVNRVIIKNILGDIESFYINKNISWREGLEWMIEHYPGLLADCYIPNQYFLEDIMSSLPDETHMDFLDKYKQDFQESRPLHNLLIIGINKKLPHIFR